MYRGLGLALALVGAQAASAATVTTITQSGAENGTTLPFQRHILRLGGATPVYVMAPQKQKVDGEGLVLYTSLDGGATWQHNLPVQNDPSERDTADLLPDDNGMGFSLVYGLEPVSSAFAIDARSDVVFLHYKLGAGATLTLDQGPVVVFHPSSTQGYFRPSLIRDSAGTLHVTASLLDGSSSGNSFTWWERVSIDNGVEWTAPEQLAAFGNSFGGGRLVAYGSKVMALYDAYRADDQGRYRTKDAGPCSLWGAEIIFADNGLYHAGAFSVTATPDGHVHLGHSDKNNQQLWYREFDGQGWHAAVQMESNGWWSNQPAVSHRGNTVFFSWNHIVSSETDMRIYSSTRASGVWSSPAVIDGTSAFKGYTSALESVLPGEALHVLWCQLAPSTSNGESVVQDGAFVP